MPKRRYAYESNYKPTHPPVLALYDPFGVDVSLNCDTTTITTHPPPHTPECINQIFYFPVYSSLAFYILQGWRYWLGRVLFVLTAATGVLLPVILYVSNSFFNVGNRFSANQSDLYHQLFLNF